MPRQEEIPGTSQPLDIAQEAALMYVEALEEKARASERAKKREEDMLKTAARIGASVIKVRANNQVWTFVIDSKTTIKKSVHTDIVVEKAAETAPA